MNIKNYGKITSGRDKKLKRKIKGIIIALIIFFAGVFIIGILTDDGPEYQERYSAIVENHTLKEQVAQLQSEVVYLKNRVSELEGQITENESVIDSLSTEEPENTEEPDWEQVSPRTEQ